VRFQPDGTKPENWVNTQGRALDIDFDQAGNLIVADAFRGLLSVSPAGKVVELATVADGFPIRYADDVDCAADGRICSQLSKKKSRPSILTTSRRSSPCPLWRAARLTWNGSKRTRKSRKQTVWSEQQDSKDQSRKHEDTKTRKKRGWGAFVVSFWFFIGLLKPMC